MLPKMVILCILDLMCNTGIKKATKTDYNTLLAIWESAVLATHDFLSEEDFLYYKSRLPIYFDHVKLFIYTETDNTIKGFLGVSEDKIEMLFIDNQYRGSGIGKALLGFAIDNLQIKKVDVNEHNKQALAFYKNSGFSEIDRSEYDSEGKHYPILYMKL